MLGGGPVLPEKKNHSGTEGKGARKRVFPKEIIASRAKNVLTKDQEFWAGPSGDEEPPRLETSQSPCSDSRRVIWSGPIRAERTGHGVEKAGGRAVPLGVNSR